MPTYEYECTKCGEHFEYFQSIKDDPMTTCEKCGAKLTKLLSAGSGLIFKGSGFYITDYKNAGAKSTSEPAKAETKPSTESKPSTGSKPTPVKSSD